MHQPSTFLSSLKTVHQLATPGLVLDELTPSPYEATPDSGFTPFSPTDFSSLFPSFDPSFALPADQGFNMTCSPQELNLPSPSAVANSPPFGMLTSPTNDMAALPQDEVVQHGEAEEDTGRGKRKRKESKFTGFRNTMVQPVAIDAPIAARNYVLPSATSRKEVPVLIQRQIKKRKLGKKDEVVAAIENGEEPAGGLDQEIVDAVKQKRLQNTVAARRSRQRKQEELQRLKDERDEWKERAVRAEALLKAAGL